MRLQYVDGSPAGLNINVPFPFFLIIFPLLSLSSKSEKLLGLLVPLGVNIYFFVPENLYPEPHCQSATQPEAAALPSGLCLMARRQRQR